MSSTLREIDAVSFDGVSRLVTTRCSRWAVESPDRRTTTRVGVVLLLSLALAPAGARPPLASSEADWIQLVEEAKARESAKEWKAAGELYRTALSRAASSEIDELERLDVLEALADLNYRHLGRPLAAVPLYEQAIEIRRARSETTGGRARATWTNLRHVYRSTGRKAEAQLMEERRNALFRNRD
jgi:tetratricopeptide (TPR) repeat protein